jgi:hypothetical protein
MNDTKTPNTNAPRKIHPQDLQALLGLLVLVLFISMFASSIEACNQTCHDLRDWNDVIEPYKSTVIVAVSTTLGYFFGKKHE